MQLTAEEIKHVAKLARLELSGEELEKYGGQLSHILSYIDMLKEVDTDNVEPTAQVTGLVNVFREDEIDEWNEQEREAALSEAPEFEDHLVKVKRVLE
jgi:aspartyl-tRNA(Asn)/glutamyl-tRNA(Gln) amidotransferase subunit C